MTGYIRRRRFGLLLFAVKDPQDLADSFLYLLLGLFQQPQHLVQGPSHLSQLRPIYVPIRVARFRSGVGRALLL